MASTTRGSVMNYHRKLQAEGEANTYAPIVAPEAEERLHTLLDALECMDTRIARELEWLDKSGAEEDLKEVVRQDILSRHQTRRLPLQNAVEELRAQHRAACPDTSN
jgi:hypothetical protein